MSLTGATANTLTAVQIRRLAHQAAVTGDEALAGACALALMGDVDARRICAERIEADAAADIAAWERDSPDKAAEARASRGTLTPAQVLERARAAARAERRRGGG